MLRTCTLAARFAALPCHAQIYTWVDREGRIRCSDKKLPDNSTEAIAVTANTCQSVSLTQPDPSAGEHVASYGTAWCAYCREARAYCKRYTCKRYTIDFIEDKIERDRAAKQAYGPLGASGVPVILPSKERINDFSIAPFARWQQPAQKP